MSVITHRHRHLFLTGFMGTGKSSVGVNVATRLHRVFYDSDELVTRMTGHTIDEIFRAEGESVFRHHESRVLRTIVGTAGAVIALGGGATTIKSNVSILRQTGRTVLLTADLRIIWARIKDDGSRPLLSAVTGVVADPDPAAFEQFAAHAQPILQSRWDLYHEAADHVIDTSKLSIGEVADQVLAWWESQGEDEPAQ